LKPSPPFPEELLVMMQSMSAKGRVTNILFVDIKTGGARLQKNQKEIKSLVERKCVAWDTY
jgi:predicted Holliday junction resolvase-like endonuclease